MTRKMSLIISSISLLVTLTLLIVTMYSWYTNNKYVSASGLVSTSKDDPFLYSLEYYSKNSYIEFNDDSLSLSNIYPSDVFYFRVKVSKKNSEESSNYNFNIQLSNIVSDLDSKLSASYSNSTYIVSYDEVPLYTSTTDAISITNSSTNEEKTLYTITKSDSTYTLSLADYKIEDVFKLYVDVDINSDLNQDNAKTLSSKESITCTNNYLYFAIEFNENASLVNDNSNCYMYQILTIKSININAIVKEN